jgi:arginase family enzyme
VLVPPFHVTHVDAHADLGNGDAGYAYIMTSLLFSALEDRQRPAPGPGETGLTEVNFLLFAHVKN